MASRLQLLCRQFPRALSAEEEGWDSELFVGVAARPGAVLRRALGMLGVALGPHVRLDGTAQALGLPLADHDVDRLRPRLKVVVFCFPSEPPSFS